MQYGVKVVVNDLNQLKNKFEYLMSKGIPSCQIVYKPEKFEIKNAKIIKQAVQETGIDISAIFMGYPDGCCFWDMKFDFLTAGINSPLLGGNRVLYLISAIPFIKELGVSDVIIHAGHISTDPFSESYTRMLGAVKIIATKFKQAGLNLLFETGPEAPIILLRLITEVGLDNLFINLDTANIIMYGCGNPVDALTTIGKYVRNTHFKDGLPPTDPYKIGKEVPIGQGNVDFHKVIKLLKGLNYDRYITIERELDEDEESILKSIDYIKNIWDKE